MGPRTHRQHELKERLNKGPSESVGTVDDRGLPTPELVMALSHHGQAWRDRRKEPASHLRVMLGGLPPGGDGDTETLQRRLQGTQAFFPPSPCVSCQTQGEDGEHGAL